MDFTPGVLIYLAAAAFLTAVIHSVGGFAGALMLAIAVAPILGIKPTVPVVAAAMVISHGSRAWFFRHSVDWPIFFTVFGFALPGMVLGIYLYLLLPEAAVAVFLGVFLLVATPLQRLLKGRRINIGRKGLAAFALPYGFLSGTSFGVAMMLGPLLLGAGLAGEVLLGTLAVNGFLLNVIKTVIFGFSPLMTREFALIGAFLGLCTLPGHYIGKQIVRRTPIRLHTMLLESVMILGGIYFLWKGLG